MEINDVINLVKEQLFCKSMVIELCDKSIGDYQRGVVQGRIEMLNYIEAKLGEVEEKDEDDS